MLGKQGVAGVTAPVAPHASLVADQRETFVDRIAGYDWPWPFLWSLLGYPQGC